MARNASKMELVIAILLIVTLILSGIAVYYASTIGDIAARLDETSSDIEMLTSSVEGLEDVTGDIADIVGAEVYTCSICGAIFPTLEDLEVHMEYYHPAPPKKILMVTQVAAHWFILAGVGPDPHFHAHMNAPHLNLMYECLFGLDPVAAMEGRAEPVPWLAKDYSVSEDGLTYTIDLRQDVKFHNTNNTMTAEDVKYSYDRLHETLYPMDLVGGFLPWLFCTSYDRTEIVNDYRIKIHMNFPDPAFLDTLCCPWWSIVEKAELEAHAEFSGGLSDHGYQWLNNEPCHDAGTGPYKIEDFKLMERYELWRCDNYWGGPPELDLPTPNFDEILFLAISEEGDARMKLERGDLDMVIDVFPETYNTYIGRPGFAVFTSPSSTWMNLWMHTVSGPLQHWKVRKAIKLAIDYDTIVDDIMLGTAYVCQNAFTGTMPGWEETAHYFERDVEAAKTLLDDAGYPDPGDPGAPGGWRFTIDLYTRPEPRFGMDFIDFSTSVKSDLAEVGINVVINVYEVGEFYAKFWDISIEGMWTPPQGAVSATEPWRLLSDMILEPHCDEWFAFNETTQAAFVPDPINFTYMQETYLKAMSTLDPDARLEIWQELDAYMLEYGPGVNLCNNGFRVIYSEDITAFYYGIRQLVPFIFYMDKKV